MSLVRASPEALRCVLEQDTLWRYDDGPTVARLLGASRADEKCSQNSR